jgi:hypothetical protein
LKSWNCECEWESRQADEGERRKEEERGGKAWREGQKKVKKSEKDTGRRPSECEKRHREEEGVR